MTSATVEQLHVDSACMHVDSACIHVDSACIHVDSACIHVDSACMHVDSACMHVDSACMHVDSACMHVDSACMHVDSACMHVDSDCMHVDSACMHVDSACMHVDSEFALCIQCYFEFTSLYSFVHVLCLLQTIPNSIFCRNVRVHIKIAYTSTVYIGLYNTVATKLMYKQTIKCKPVIINYKMLVL